MELKSKIEIIDKQANIINKKLIAYLAIAGGSWLYGILPNKNELIVILSSIAFLYSIVGIFTNILNLTKLQHLLKRLNDE